MMIRDRIVEQLLLLKTSAVKKAETELEALQDDPEYFPTLNEVMTWQGERNRQIRLLAASAAKKSIGLAIGDDNVGFVEEFLYQLFFNWKINFDVKEILEDTLSQSLMWFEPQMTEKWLQAITEAINSLKDYKQDPLNTSESFESQREAQDALLAIISLIMAFLGNIDNLSLYISDWLLNVHNLALQIPCSKLDMIERKNRVITLWSYVLQELAETGEPNSISLAAELAVTKPLLTEIGDIYEWYGTNGLIWCSEDTTPESLPINRVKIEALTLNIKLFSFTRRFQKLQRVLKIQIEECEQLFMDTLEEIPILKQNNDWYCLEQMAVTLLRLLNEAITYFSDFCDKHWLDLIEKIILPLLAVDEEELKMFQTSPQEYNQIIEDCCNQQEGQTLKPALCSLLEQLCEQRNEAFDHVINICLSAIKKQKEGCGSQTQPKISLETSLMVLSIFCYKICSSPACLQVIKSQIDYDRTNMMTDIELYRFYTFLAYSYNDIYSDVKSGEHWIRHAVSYNGHSTVKRASWDFLSNIADEYYSDELFTSFSSELSQSSPNIFVWSALGKMLKIYIDRMSEGLLINLVWCIKNRMALRLSTLRKTDSKHQIISGLQLLTRICNKPSAIAGKQQLMSEIWNVASNLDSYRRLGVEDEAFYVLLELSRVFSALDNNYWSIFPHMIRLGQQTQYQKIVYSVLVGTFATKGQPEWMNPILQLVQQGAEMLFKETSSNGPTHGNGLAHHLWVIINILSSQNSSIGREWCKWAAGLCERVLLFPSRSKYGQAQHQAAGTYIEILQVRSVIILLMLGKYDMSFAIQAQPFLGKIIGKHPLISDLKALCHSLQALTQISRQPVFFATVLDLLVPLVLNGLDCPGIGISSISRIDSAAEKIRQRCLRASLTMHGPINSCPRPYLCLQNTFSQLKERDYELFSQIVENMASKEKLKGILQLSETNSRRKIFAVKNIDQADLSMVNNLSLSRSQQSFSTSQGEEFIFSRKAEINEGWEIADDESTEAVGKKDQIGRKRVRDELQLSRELENSQL